MSTLSEKLKEEFWKLLRRRSTSSGLSLIVVIRVLMLRGTGLPLAHRCRSLWPLWSWVRRYCSPTWFLHQSVP